MRAQKKLVLIVVEPPAPPIVLARGEWVATMRQEVNVALESLPVSRRGRPKLGQHFLRDKGYRQRIAEALAILPNDLVVEIGPGQGAMTGLIAKRVWQVVAVEIDAALAQRLREAFRSVTEIEIVHADILSTDLTALCQSHGSEYCFVFGNLPYYVTSPIIHRLCDFAHVVRRMALLVQREVAQRLTAQPGSRDYGYLSVFIQTHSRPRIVFDVPPGAFSPPPEVHSTLVDFQMVSRFPGWGRKELVSFLDFVKGSFAQKRKNLLNNLARTYSRKEIDKLLTAIGLPHTVRAEQLTLEQFASLHRGAT